MPRKTKPTPAELQRYRTGQTNAAGATICGAKTRGGKLCPTTQVMENGRCRMHGGATPAGVASPHTKHGRYSRVLPTRMAADYQASLQDPDLLSVRHDIALLDARLADVLGRVDTGEAGTLWRAAQDAYKAFVASKDDLAKARAAIDELGDILTRGAGDWAAWREIGDILEQRRRAVESEGKREREMEQAIPVARVYLLMGAVAATIAIHVKDSNVLTSIEADISRIIEGSFSRPAIAGRVD